MVLQCTEEFEVDTTGLADSIRRVEVVHADAVIHGVLVEADRFLNFIAITDQMLLPDMSLTVSLCCEGKLADKALERSLSIMRPEMTDQCTLV